MKCFVRGGVRAEGPDRGGAGVVVPACSFLNAKRLTCFLVIMTDTPHNEYHFEAQIGGGILQQPHVKTNRTSKRKNTLDCTMHLVCRSSFCQLTVYGSVGGEPTTENQLKAE